MRGGAGGRNTPGGQSLAAYRTLVAAVLRRSCTASASTPLFPSPSFHCQKRVTFPPHPFRRLPSPPPRHTHTRKKVQRSIFVRALLPPHSLFGFLVSLLLSRCLSSFRFCPSNMCPCAWRREGRGHGVTWHEFFFSSAHSDMFHAMSFIPHSLLSTVPFLTFAAHCRSLGIRTSALSLLCLLSH